MRKRCRHRSFFVSEYAFSLIEMAVVLVIIGLLSGGVLAGRQLILVATMQAQVRQLRDYDTAVATFALKYNCVPGDCKTTSSYWPDLVDGNGNEKIENSLYTFYDSTPVTWSPSIEYQNFFITLSRAGYISQSFETPLAASGIPVIGQQLPALKWNSQAGMFASDTQSFQVLTSTSRNPIITTLRKGTNALWLVACKVSSANVRIWDDNCAVFKAVDMASLDTKIDDGVPLQGKFLGFGGSGNSTNKCLTINATDLTASTYKSNTATAQCQGAYLLD